jgi:hypothetical protein
VSFLPNIRLDDNWTRVTLAVFVLAGLLGIGLALVALHWFEN